MNDTYYFSFKASTTGHHSKGKSSTTHVDAFHLGPKQGVQPGQLAVVDIKTPKSHKKQSTHIPSTKSVVKAHNKAIKDKQDAGKLKVVDAGKTKGGIDIKKAAEAHNKTIKDRENKAKEQKHAAQTTSHPVAKDLHAKSAVNNQLAAHHLKNHVSHLQAHQHAVDRRMVHFDSSHHLDAANHIATVADHQQKQAEQIKQQHPSHLQAHQHAVIRRLESTIVPIPHERHHFIRHPASTFSDTDSLGDTSISDTPIPGSNSRKSPDIQPGKPIPKLDSSMLPVQKESFGFTNETKNKTAFNKFMGNNPNITINPNIHPKATQSEPKGFIPVHPLSNIITKGTPNPFINPNPNLAFPDVGKGLTNAVNSIGQTLNHSSIPSQIINTPAKNPIKSVTTPTHHFQHHITVQQTFGNPQKLAEFNAQPQAVKTAEINRQIQQHSNLIKSINAGNLHSHPDANDIQAKKLAKTSGDVGMMGMIGGGGGRTPAEQAAIKASEEEDDQQFNNQIDAIFKSNSSASREFNKHNIKLPKNKVILNTFTMPDGTQIPIKEPENQTELDKILHSSPEEVNLAHLAISSDDITTGVIGIGAVLLLTYIISEYI